MFPVQHLEPVRLQEGLRQPVGDGAPLRPPDMADGDFPVRGEVDLRGSCSRDPDRGRAAYPARSRMSGNARSASRQAGRGMYRDQTGVESSENLRFQPGDPGSHDTAAEQVFLTPGRISLFDVEKKYL